MDIEHAIKKAGDTKRAQALTLLLKKYLEPAFSALPKKEIDLAFLDALEQLDCIESNPTEYELVQKLRVTRSKARNLYYNRALRSTSTDQLDEMIKTAVQNPRIHKDGNFFVLDIDNPLAVDHLRSKIRNLGYSSDGSFSPSLVKLPLRAFTALVEDSIPEDKRNRVKQKLIEAGAPDNSLRGALQGALKQVGKKIAQDAGEAIAESASDYITPIIEGTVTRIGTMFRGLFTNDENDI